MPALTHGLHPVQSTAGFENIGSGAWPVMFRDNTEIEQPDGQDGRHQHDRPAAAGAACRQHGNLGGVAGADQQPGVGQQPAGRKTPRQPAEPGVLPRQHRDIVELHRQTPLQGIRQAETLVVVPGLAITETPDNPRGILAPGKGNGLTV